MKTKEITLSEVWEYIKDNYGCFIGIMEVMNDCPGIWLKFYKPDRSFFVHIVGQKNRDDFVDLLYKRVDELFVISSEFRTAGMGKRVNSY
jgi:hypothetical protein